VALTGGLSIVSRATLPICSVFTSGSPAAMLKSLCCSAARLEAQGGFCQAERGKDAFSRFDREADEEAARRLCSGDRCGVICAADARRRFGGGLSENSDARRVAAAN